MTTRKIDFPDTHAFSSFFLDYIQQKDSLKKFYERFPSLANFEAQLQDKSSFSQANRTLLADGLTKQYSQLTISKSVKANIDSLRDNKTFTVTTGHQLNVFTGPLYFIFKIVTVINACKALKEKYPAYHFVPLYWMASEDHDYEEIKSFRLYGKKYTWQTEQQGAVGRFETKDFKDLINQLPGDVSVFKDAYEKNKTLASAVRQYVNALFGVEGLVVVDGDDRQLKTLFTKVIQDDLFNHSAKKVVDSATQELQSLGYHTQVNAREINLFYLDAGVRSRLEREGDTFRVVDSTLTFSKSEIEKMILAEPEKFSPNVVLRPLYQEMILPNLAYVGGPAELVYWLQLKGVFKFFQIPLPILMPRNFGMVVDAPTQKKFSKTGLDVKDLFQEKNYLFNHWVANNSQHDLSLGKQMQSLQTLLNEIRNKATAIDSTLSKLVAAENQRALNGLERIEKKMLKAEKRKHEEKLKQIETVKDALFPNGSLQERTDNFLNFYQSNPDFIQKLLAAFDAFDFRFNVLMND
jgi:bacillithiol biosynthesis cysteine-adding enzyme BshC